jgi:hypothetical protein
MKKAFFIILAIVAIYFFYYIYQMKKLKNKAKTKPSQDTPSGPHTPVSAIHPDAGYSYDENILKFILDDISKQFSKEIAQNVEKIYRLETSHFKSDQFKATGSAGMLAFSSIYPYGWTSLVPFWMLNPQFAPTGIGYQFTEGGTTYRYLKFPNYGGFYTLAYFLSKKRPGNWFSTVPEKQQDYERKLDQIQPKLVV